MGQTISTTMLADAKAVEGSPDLAPLLGTWVNAKRDTDHITSVVLSSENDGLFVRLLGSSSDAPVDWGVVEAAPYVFTGTTDVAGFHARYSLGDTQVEIAANVKFGILVIQTYTSFPDNRLSQFSREFFYRPEGSSNGSVGSGVEFLVGDWVNTHSATKWIRGFTLGLDGDAVKLRVRGAAEPVDWGEVGVNTFVDAAGDPAFHAVYELDSVSAVLAGNTGKSIIIIAGFFRGKEESDNVFCREFFVPR